MRNWLRSRAGLKVISLVLAMITWFFVKAVTSDSRLVENVPLEIRVKPGMAVEDASTRMLNVTVRVSPGRRWIRSKPRRLRIGSPAAPPPAK